MGEIKKHDFFKKVDWKELLKKKVSPPREMFVSDLENNYYEILELQRNEQIHLVDNDYNQTTSMINRVKNFTFARNH
jgi:hypothetical protein